MKIDNFPRSRILKNIPDKKVAKLFATAYAFYAYAHRKTARFWDDSRITGRIVGGFPVWYASRERVDARPGSIFRRVINGEDYWFYKSDSEFVALQFGMLNGGELEGDGVIFSHLEYDDKKILKLSSVFIVSIELLTRMGLFLSDLGEQATYPRIIVIPGSSQCGLLVTTNHHASRSVREHVIFPLPEISLGRENRQGDDFRESKISLDQFVLSSRYPMKIDSLDRSNLI